MLRSPISHGDEEEEYIITIKYTDDNIAFYNKEVLNDLGIDAEISILIKIPEDDIERSLMGGGNYEENLTIPYRYFYTGIKGISNMFVFPKIKMNSMGVSSTGDNTKKSMFSFLFNKPVNKPVDADTAAKAPVEKDTVDEVEEVNKTEGDANENGIVEEVVEGDSDVKENGIVEEVVEAAEEDAEGDVAEEAAEEAVEEAAEEAVDEDADADTNNYIKIILHGKQQPFLNTYAELFQQRIWIEKAMSMGKQFITPKIYKINEKIILVGSLVPSIEEEIRQYERDRNRELLKRIENTELYKRIMY